MFTVALYNCALKKGKWIYIFATIGFDTADNGPSKFWVDGRHTCRNGLSNLMR